MSSISDLIKIPLAALAGVTIAAIVLLFFYEGIRLPLIGQVLDGRVASQVKLAISTMASAAELAAANALLELERTKRTAAEAMAAEASKRASAALLEQERQDAEIDRLREEVKAITGLTYPSKEDLEWSAKHR